MKKWRVYLLGKRFTVVTDCNAFAITIKKDDLPPRVASWALQEFQFRVEHRAGTKMSRLSCFLITDSTKSRLVEAQDNDKGIKAVKAVLTSHDVYEDYYLQYNILYKDVVNELLVVPNSMQEEIISKEGHFRYKKTRDILEKSYYIPGIQQKVERVVRGCLIIDSKRGKNEGLLSPIDKAQEPLGTYHIDHVGPLTDTKKKYNHKLAIVDGFSKFVWLYPTKSGTEEVLEKLKKQAAVLGNPHRIVTDRRTAFTSGSFKDYCSRGEIQLLHITTGMPRGNGQVERILQQQPSI